MVLELCLFSPACYRTIIFFLIPIPVSEESPIRKLTKPSLRQLRPLCIVPQSLTNSSELLGKDEEVLPRPTESELLGVCDRSLHCNKPLPQCEFR